MTVMTNVVLVLKDSEGNIGIVKPLTDNDIIKIANAITDVGQVVDPATHMPIEATKTSAGVVQLATAQDITNGTAGKVVDAQELNNFAQTLPAANGITDVSSGDNSNQLVVSRIGGSKTLTIDNVEHADNADEATHATQADTATSANSVAWDNVSGKPSSYTPSSHTHDDRYYTESEVNTLLAGKANSDHDHSRYGMYFADVCADTNTGWYESRYKGEGDANQTHLYINDYFGIHFHTAGSFDVNGHAIISAGNIGSQSVNYANSAGSVAWGNVSGRPTALSQFSNDSGYITTDGAAYPRRVGGVTMNFNWSGQGGQPTWLWGGEDGTNMYVYNPANFSVNYANSAGYVQGNNNSANAANALLRSGSGRTDSSPEGDTWIFLDELGGSDAPWGFKHNQAANTIGFYGAGTETSSINLSNGHFSGTAENSNYTYWLRTSSHSDHLFHTEWDGSYFWTYVAAPDGGYRAVRVERANSSGWADTSGRVRTQSNTDWYMNCNWDGSYFQTDCISDGGSRLPINVQKANYADGAGSVAWGNVSGRPTALSQFSNDSGYITTDGAAYPRRVGGVTMNFNWSGQNGQPSWLWGGNDGTNMYVYNPSNFSVNYANTAGNGVHSSGGSWIRFNNGIQLVWQTGVQSNTWTSFSVAFNTTTYMSIFASINNGTYTPMMVRVADYSATRVYVRVLNTNGSEVSSSVSVLVCGTWK